MSTPHCSRWTGIFRCAFVGALLAAPGCGQGQPVPPAANPGPVVQNPDAAHDGRPLPPADEFDAVRAVTVPEGWKVYTPPEGDFSVAVPADPADSSSAETKIGKVRRYSFRKDEASMSVELYSDRPAKFATNTVQELRDSPDDIVPGAIRDVSLPGMPGIEFRMRGRIGETVFREYCSPDNSRSISLYVQKDVGAGFSEAEVRAFLDSFKLLP